MEKKLLRLLKVAEMLTKYTLAGLLLQCLLLNLLIAGTGSAQSIFEVKVAVDHNRPKLAQLFAAIESQTDFNFTYSPKKIKLEKAIVLSGRQYTVGDLLTEVAEKTQLNFKQINNNILVSKRFLTKTARLSVAVGRVKGKITDENGLPLPGATIMLLDMENIGAITDVNGRFTLLDVPEGSHDLQVSYIGYNTISKKIEVVGGVTATFEVRMEPGVMIGEEVLILGDRLKGQAKALNQQRTNANITNVVAADQIGRFPDANIGDAMKRIPGITIQNDQGEARDLIIRGLAPQLNSVMLNGERIPSAEGDNRRIQLDLIPADMIQTVQVNKAVTPDMDADAIGGAVNLITRSAPEGLRVSGTLASGYNFLSDKPIWTGSFILGDRFFGGKLGAIFSASYNNHNFGSDNIEAVWIDTDDFGPVLDEFDIREYKVQRVRRSASLDLDYQIDPNNTIYLSGIYNWRDDWENRFRFRASKMEDAYDATRLDPSDEDYDPNAFVEISEGLYAVDARVGRQSKGGIASDRVESKRLEDQRVRNLTLRGDHLIGNKLKLNWSGTYARASEERPNERYISYRSSGIPVVLDVLNPEKPLVTPVNENNYQSLELNEITEERQFTFEEDLNGRIDLQLPVADKGILKFGSRYRNKFKKRDNNFFEFVPTGGVNDGDSHPDLGGSWNSADEEYGDLLMGNVPVIDQSDPGYLNGGQFQSGFFADNEFVGRLDLNNESLYEREDKPEEYLPGNYSATEIISGGYAMLDYQFTPKLSAILGLRVEHTNIDYSGFQFDVDNEVGSATEGDDSYTNWLPGVHLKYDFTPNTILRVAWTNTIARPNYFDLVPFVEFSPDDDEVSLGNPALEPAESMNFDLSFENYFQSIGLVSIGGFYKDIDNFVYTITQENATVPGLGTDLQVTSPDNGGSAEVYGMELAVQRQLDFLPGFWKGFGIYFNYTLTRSSTEGIQGREEDDLSLPGTAENMVNASLSYETEKLVLRASLNFASDYIDEIGDDNFNDRYYDRQTFIDLNGSYAFTPNWRFFFEVNNLTNQPLRYYQGVRQRVMQEEFYNVRMNFGLKFDLFGN